MNKPAEPGQAAPSACQREGDRFGIIFHKCSIPASLMRLAVARYTDVNEAWCRFSGYSREEALGRTSTELGLMRPESLAQLRALLRQDASIRNAEVMVGSLPSPSPLTCTDASA